MEIWGRIGKWGRSRIRKEIDWKEMAKDLRADLGRSAFASRTTYYFS